MLNRQQVWWRVARALLVRLRDIQREGYTKMVSSKCEDCNSAGGGGGVNSAGGGRPRTSATDIINSTMARERKRMRGRERDGERNSNKKEEADRERAHSANTWIDVT
jgi:hypothetical protein